MIAWSHDLAWVNQLYAPTMHSGYPWDLLRVPAPGVRYVVVSRERQTELSALWDGNGDADILVAPNGIDPYSFLGLSLKPGLSCIVFASSSDSWCCCYRSA
jgi:hypothetical protein